MMPSEPTPFSKRYRILEGDGKGRMILTESEMQSIIQEAVEYERWACANLADVTYPEYWEIVRRDSAMANIVKATQFNISKAIRDRGLTP